MTTPKSRRTRASRVLVCYYSMTGHTRRLAAELHRALDCGIEELREPRPRTGLVGMLRALVDAMRRRTPPIVPIRHEPEDLDLLVLGGPIWAGRMASPVRTYAAGFARRAPRVALFCTEGARGADQAFAEIEALCGHERVASLVVDERHLAESEHCDQLADFIRHVHQALDVPAPVPPPATAHAQAVH
jgi:flavodoxin